MKLLIGVDGISFDSAHYTLSSKGNEQLHGHSYKVSVEIEGDKIDPTTGFLLDFGILRKVVVEVVKEWDHKLIVSQKDLSKIKIEAPFKLELKVIESEFPTVENIGLEIAKEIYHKLGGKFRVILKIYEGEGNYAIIYYPD